MSNTPPIIKTTETALLSKLFLEISSVKYLGRRDEKIIPKINTYTNCILAIADTNVTLGAMLIVKL